MIIHQLCDREAFGIHFQSLSLSLHQIPSTHNPTCFIAYVHQLLKAAMEALRKESKDNKMQKQGHEKHAAHKPEPKCAIHHRQCKVSILKTRLSKKSKTHINKGSDSNQ